MKSFNGLFLRFKTYVYVNVITIHITYFAISAILGIKHLGSEDSSSYIIVLLISSILSYLVILIDLFRFRKIKKKFFLFVSILIFILISYIIGGSYDEFANKTILLFFILVVPSMLSGYFIARDYDSNKLLNGFLFVSFIIFLGLLQSLSELISSSVIDLLTVFGGGQYQALSYFSAFGYSTLLNYMLFYRSNKSLINSFSLILILVVFLAGIFLSGGRGGLIVAFVATFLFLYLKYGVKKIILYSVCLVIGLFLLYQILLSVEFNNKERLIQSVERLFSFISNEGIDMSQTSNRNDFYERSLSLISERPIIGYGIFGYINYTGEFYSHNLFLDVLLHGGIFYLFVWLVLIFLFFLKLYFVLKNNREEIIVLVPFLSSFILLLFSGSYIQESMLWFSIAFVFTFRSKKMINKI